MNFLRRSFVILLTLPAGIALGVGLLSIVGASLERSFLTDSAAVYGVLSFSEESARALLGVVAGAAMTALSLTYSLVLVVFTLAASSIGPRLLNKFTQELVNQITAGLLGGTFLYALAALYMLSDAHIPHLTIAGAGALAAISVAQLIYFVRHVSSSVAIDHELAAIAERLTTRLTALRGRWRESDASDAPEMSEAVRAASTGYIGRIDEARLCALAKERGLVLQLAGYSGAYVVEGELLVEASGAADDETAEAMRRLIPLEPARDWDETIEFSINLMIEIALRALSPGVNDTFTAIAAVHSLCGALVEIADEDAREMVVCDDEGEMRLILPGLFLPKLMDQIFHPLRRASADNVMMAENLAMALRRLAAAGGEEMRVQAEKNARLLIADLSRRDLLEADVEMVRAALGEGLQVR